MNNFITPEEALHYAASFLERYEDKNPVKRHREAAKALRELSNYLIENLYRPTYITILRKPKTDNTSA